MVKLQKRKEKVLNKPIRSFRDLEVYQNSYKGSVLIATRILPKLPDAEKFDLKDQLGRSSKAVPRLIAEGYAKKHQKFGFQKYIDDAMAESNETIVSLEHVKDIYKIEVALCLELVDLYDKTSRQLFNLAKAWDSFKNQRRKTTNHTGSENENL
ncbi:MAG: four helix bundle protein [Patescibacteria group bacterium]|nr:four helix bundle protein [Patescibacteria group bacterium]